MNRSVRFAAFAVLMGIGLAVVGCESTQTAATTREEFIKKDSTLNTLFKGSYAYAIFPKIVKGGLVIGAANGTGDVYEQGRLIGTAEVSQATVGAQIGGQDYAMVIFFENRAALQKFKDGSFKFAANASGVAVKEGGATANNFSDGAAVYTMPLSGLMGEAAIGGQQFKFYPK